MILKAMKTLKHKIYQPILAAIVGAFVGALSGSFVWALIGALGFWALAHIAQNVAAVFQRTNSTGEQLTLVDDGAVPRSIDKGPDWLRKWKEDIHYSPGYKGTPGNIWNGPKWTSDD